MDQATQNFGSLEAHVLLVNLDGARCSRHVVVRLGWVLFWADKKFFEKQKKDEKDLKTWRKLGKKRHKFPLERGLVKLCRPRANIIELENEKKHSSLTFDFGEEAQICDDWYTALSLMTRQWKDLLDEVKDAGLQDEIRRILEQVAGGHRATSSEVEKARKAEEKSTTLDAGVEKLRKAHEREDKVFKFFEEITKAFNVMEGPVRDVLGKLPILGAGFQVIALGMSFSSSVAALKANLKLESEIREDMAYVSGLTFLEMLLAARRGSEGKEHMRTLSKIMANLESDMRELELYLVEPLPKKFLFRDQKIFERMRDSLKKHRGELFESQTLGLLTELVKMRPGSKLNCTPDEGTRIEDQKWKTDFSTVPPLHGHDLESLPAVQSLLEAVLDTSKQDGPGVIGACGIGGTGKTTACKMVANNERIKDMFSEGIFWIGLGVDSTAQDVLEGLVRILEKSCGSGVASKPARSRLKDVVTEASSKLRERKIMIVVDNVFPGADEGVAVDWIYTLYPLVGAEGCLVYSTRYARIGNTCHAKIVPFRKVTEHHLEVSIFDRYLGLAEGKEGYDRNARDSILKVCDGLPLAIATAALHVRALDYKWDQIEIDDHGNSGFGEELVTKESDENAGGHPGLAKIISETLESLDKGRFMGRLKSKMSQVDPTSYSWSQMYCLLAVFPKKMASIPIGMLGALWQLRPRKAKLAASLYCEVGLAESTGDDEIGLHDLQSSYCSWRATGISWEEGGLGPTSAEKKDLGDTAYLHARLVQGLPFLKGGSGRSASFGSKDILSTLVYGVEDHRCDEYLTDNAVRHIAMAHGKFGSLLRLLLQDYRWVRRKAERRGEWGLCAEYDLAVKTLEEFSRKEHNVGGDGQVSSSSSVSDDLEGYKAIKSALQEMPLGLGHRLKGCMSGEGDVRFPDCGLASYLACCLAFRKCGVNTSEGRRESSYLMPEASERCTRRGFGESELPRELQDAQQNDCDNGGSSKDSVVASLLSSVRMHAVGPWLYPLTNVFREEGMIYAGGYVRAVAPSMDNKFVYVARIDGALCRFELESGALVDMLGDAYEHRWLEPGSVAISAGDGCEELVVLGSGNCIRMWNMPSKEKIADIRLPFHVTHVVVSEDGTRLIAVGSERIVIFIKQKYTTWPETRREEHHFPKLRDVALSRDGREVVVVSNGNTVTVLGEKWSSQSEEGPMFTEVESFRSRTDKESVLFASGKHNAEVVLRGGSFSAGVTVWERESSKERVLTRDLVYCLAPLGSGGEKVIGLCHSDFRIWKIDTGDVILSISFSVPWFFILADFRNRLAITRDGQHIVGVGRRVLKVWDVEESNTKGGYMRPSAMPCRNCGKITQAAASEDGDTVITVHDGKELQIWSAKSGIPIYSMIEPSTSPILCVAISKDGETVVTGHSDGLVVWWNVKSKRRQAEWKSGLSLVQSISLSKNGLFCAFCGYHAERAAIRFRCFWQVVDVKTQEVVAEYSCSDFTCSKLNSFKRSELIMGSKLALARYAEEKGLEKAEFVPSEYRIPDVSLDFHSPKLDPLAPVELPTFGTTEESANRCLGTASLVLPDGFHTPVMLPYVSGLDPTRDTAGSRLGMVGIYGCTNGSALHLFLVLDK